jgi:hypothetical protein
MKQINNFMQQSIFENVLLSQLLIITSNSKVNFKAYLLDMQKTYLFCVLERQLGCFLLVATLAYSLTLEMESLRSSETSVSTTRLYIPDKTILHSHRRENPKSNRTLLEHWNASS